MLQLESDLNIKMTKLDWLVDVGFLTLASCFMDHIVTVIKLALVGHRLTFYKVE